MPTGTVGQFRGLDASGIMAKSMDYSGFLTTTTLAVRPRFLQKLAESITGPLLIQVRYIQ